MTPHQLELRPPVDTRPQEIELPAYTYACKCGRWGVVGKLQGDGSYLAWCKKCKR